MFSMVMICGTKKGKLKLSNIFNVTSMVSFNLKDISLHDIPRISTLIEHSNKLGTLKNIYVLVSLSEVNLRYISLFIWQVILICEQK